MLKSNFTIIVFLGIIASWTLFYKLGEPNFYHLRNESRRARIAQEMLETGSMLIPRLEGEVILTKPPLFYWAIGLLSQSGQVTELTARIPSAVSSLGTVVFTYLLGCLLFNRYTGFVSALVLVTTNFFMHQARYAELDSMLTFCTTSAIYFFLKGFCDREKRLCWIIFFL